MKLARVFFSSLSKPILRPLDNLHLVRLNPKLVEISERGEVDKDLRDLLVRLAQKTSEEEGDTVVFLDHVVAIEVFEGDWVSRRRARKEPIYG